jgi:putative peptide zinc metalloprotease protein
VEHGSQFRPKLRAELQFGPPETKGMKLVFYANDGYTDQFYRVGEREHFLFSRMDGQRTLAELAEAYEERFGKQLDARGWANLFKLMDARQMLENYADLERLDALKEDAKKNKLATGRWFFRRVSLVNPDSFLERLLPLMKFAFNRWFIVSSLVAIVAVEIFVLMNFAELRAGAFAGSRHWEVWVGFVLMLTASAVLHETGHGLACKYFGGKVNDMGVMWRLLWFFPYCKLDHVVLFHRRRQRVYVAFAGTLVSLFLLIPFAVLWRLSPEGSYWYLLGAKLLTLYNFFSLLNLFPLIPLDGYYMLAHALGMSELRQESQVFVKKVLFNEQRWDEEYSLREKRVYGVFGLLSIVMTLAVLTFTALFWRSVLASSFGDTRAWLFAAAMVLLAIFGRRLRKIIARVFKWSWAALRHRKPLDGENPVVG